MSNETDEPRARRNPFSAMAVAKITGFGDSTAPQLTIRTEAVRRATAYLDEYLRAGPPNPDSPAAGEVIAIVGDYGTGKTHLAMELVRRAEKVLGDPTQAMYLDTTADSFVVLYRRFIDKLGLDGVRARVSEYYARTVVGSLDKDDLSAQIVNLFQAGDLTPQDAVDRLGLMESALLRQVQGTLRRVTDNEAFGTALTLLLRSGFDAAVWDWLIGKQPAQVLVERGITEPIGTEVAALEAMGVFAMLYGRQQARFVLVIDELERIFAGSRQRDSDTVAGFQKLLEVFANAGACLVLCGLPEFYDMLDDSGTQRVSRLVETTDLSAAEVGAFIRLAQQAASGRDDLAPFTPDTVNYLRDLARGNVRKVIRLCHEVYRVFDEQHAAQVTDDMVREAVRRQPTLQSSGDIHGLVRDILDVNGWSFLENHAVGPDARADFWVTFADRTGGCAVLISGPVLTSEDADATAARIAAVRAVTGDGAVVLVVNGVLAGAYAEALATGLSAQPLVYAERGFTKRFRALIAAMSGELEQSRDEGSISGVQQLLDQLNRQQSAVLTSLREVTGQLDDARSASERRLVTIERAIGGGAQAEPAPADGALPAEVNQHFLDATDALAELSQIEAMMADLFLGPHSQETVNAVQNRLSQNDVRESTGVAFMIRAAVLAFRTAVVDWYRVVSQGPEGRPDAALEQLDLICQRYDDATEFLPTYKLWPLIRLSPWGGHSGPAQRERRNDRVQQTLMDLSPQVRRSMARAVLASED